MPKSPKNPAPNRTTMLKAIKQYLNAVYQWGEPIQKKRVSTGFCAIAFKYMYKAEALIEILEVHDCGSTGGFDPPHKGLNSLEERYEALLNKKY